MRYITTGELTPFSFREAFKVVYRRTTRESVKLILSAKRVDVAVDNEHTRMLLSSIFNEDFSYLACNQNSLVPQWGASDKILLIVPYSEQNTYDFWSISFNNGHEW